MNTKQLLILFLMFTFYQKTFSQDYQNIPKGYEPYYLVSSPDTSKSISHFFWVYENANKSLFVQCGFGKNSDIIWLDTDTWEIKKVIHLDKDTDRFLGITKDFRTLVMGQKKVFWIFLEPIFQRTRFILIDLESGRSISLKEKKMKLFIEKHGTLYRGIHSSYIDNMVLSPDKNILIAPFTFAQENPLWKFYELAIFNYVGHKNYTRGLCDDQNVFSVYDFFDKNGVIIYPKPDFTPQYQWGKDDLQEAFYHTPLPDKNARNVTFDVKIGFTVNCKGQPDTFFMISEYESFFMQSLGYQTMDILRNMPDKWQPAVKNGQNVDCIQVLDVKVVNGRINKITYK